MDSQSKAIESTKKYLTAAASIAASAILARTIINEYLPDNLGNFISSSIDSLFSRFSNEHAIVIQEKEGHATNELYDASTTYLRTRITSGMRRLKASKNEEQNNISLNLDDGEELVESFNGIPYRWQLIIQQENRGGTRKSSGNSQDSSPSQVRWYKLSFNKKHKDTTLRSYLPHILERAADIKASDRRLNIHLNYYDYWNPVELKHPATFETLAMEAELKKTIIEDLDRFAKRKDYYKRIGKAWKRGYLLFGPPGTGKSSLIAAIANYLRLDIYDFDLNNVRDNDDLKVTLVGIPNKSILVIEDIDRSIDLLNREEEKRGRGSFPYEVTLSGFLNIIDGLWSASGEERIIIFTTNNKERLDPALLRPGRMDLHIYMGYCKPYGFRVLTSNCHTIDEHPMFEEIEGLLKEVEATPAEVAEQLMRSDVAEVALGCLIELLKGKRNGGDEGKGNRGEEKNGEEVGKKEVRSEIAVVDHEPCGKLTA